MGLRDSVTMLNTHWVSAEHTKQNKNINSLFSVLLALAFYWLITQKWLLHTSFHFRKVRMHVQTSNKITRIYNVIGILRGALEPGEHQMFEDFNSFFLLYLLKLYLCCKKLRVFLDKHAIWSLEKFLTAFLSFP